MGFEFLWPCVFCTPVVFLLAAWDLYCSFSLWIEPNWWAIFFLFCDTKGVFPLFFFNHHFNWAQAEASHGTPSPRKCFIRLAAAGRSPRVIAGTAPLSKRARRVFRWNIQISLIFSRLTLSPKLHSRRILLTGTLVSQVHWRTLGTTSHYASDRYSWGLLFLFDSSSGCWQSFVCFGEFLF